MKKKTTIAEAIIKQDVDSSNLESVAYDTDEKTLTVKFLSGGKYEYYDVPQQVFEDMIDAPSKGSFLAKKIKGKYDYNKI